MNENTATELGMNRTGALMSPIDSKKTTEGAATLTNPPDGDASDFAANRIRYMKEADPVGTMPLPGTIKGAFSALQEKVLGGNHTFMDKLGERLAFERMGTRLYEALLSKYYGAEDKESLPELGRLEQFYLEELKHFQMLSEVMVKIGGDPTAMSPSADVAGVAGAGWVQVIADPRTTFKQSLETILQAELVDNACWEVLIELAEGVGLSDVATQFQLALNEEAVHLKTVKEWVLQLNLDGTVLRPDIASDVQ